MSENENNICMTEIKNSAEETAQLSVLRDKQDSGKRTSKITKKFSENLFLKLALGLLSGMFYAAATACVKYLEELDPGQLAVYQFAGISLFALPWAIISCENMLGPNPNTRYWLLLCGLFDAATVYLAFFSFRRLPLSEASVLTSTVPVFVSIASVVLLGENVGKWQAVAIGICVLGIALVGKLPLLIKTNSIVYTQRNIHGLIATAFAIVTETIHLVLLRKLQDVNAFVKLFVCGFVSTVINAFLTVIFGKFTLPTCGINQLLILCIAVLSFLSQLLLINALEKEQAGPVSVLLAAGDIIVAFILDFTIFHTTPDYFMISGTVLVMFSVVLVGFIKGQENVVKKK